LFYSSAALDVSPAAEVRELGTEIANLYKNTVEALQDGFPLDPKIDYQTLYAFNGFSSIAKKPGVGLWLTNRALTQRFADNVAAVLQPEIKSFGSVTGRLERISVHNFDTFTLYPPVESESVECVFPREKLEEVLRSVASVVTVYGKMHYAVTKAFPVRCEVESFEPVKMPESLPTLLNACGLLKSDVPSEIAIRELRNEW
jgi:predicted phosphohydrolase